MILAVLGALLVAGGFALWSLPFGIVTGGVECLAAAYVSTYLRARAAR